MARHPGREIVIVVACGNKECFNVEEIGLMVSIWMNKITALFLKYGWNIFKANLQIFGLNLCCPLCVGDYWLPMAISWQSASLKEAQCQHLVWFKSTVQLVESFCAQKYFFLLRVLNSFFSLLIFSVILFPYVFSCTYNEIVCGTCPASDDELLCDLSWVLGLMGQLCTV